MSAMNVSLHGRFSLPLLYFDYASLVPAALTVCQQSKGKIKRALRPLI
jgi:hypothetical protein